MIPAFQASSMAKRGSFLEARCCIAPAPCSNQRSAMDPFVRAALAVGLLALVTRAGELGRPAGARASRAPVGTGSAQRSADAEVNAPCPRGTLPDGNVCVPVPDPNALGQALIEEQNEHHDRSGQL